MVKMKKYDVVIAGYTCVDIIPDFKKNDPIKTVVDFFKPGKLIEIEGLKFVLGGVVANTGLALKKFGKKVFLNGLVGDDYMGNIVKSNFEKYDVSEGIITTDKAGTAFGIVIAPPGIDRIFLESPGCNQIFDIGFIKFDMIAQSRLFHFGYPPLLKQFYGNAGSQLSEMFNRVQQIGVITSLDFSLPDPESESGKINWLAIMDNVLPFTDIFVPSVEEVLQIFVPLKFAEIQTARNGIQMATQIPVQLIREVGKIAIDKGAKIVLIKVGERGAFLITGDVSTINKNSNNKLDEDNWNFRELWCEAYHAEDLKIINANGAGDTAVAAFLSAILDGESIELAIKYAAMAGRNNLYCNDIYTELTDWEEMTAAILAEENELIQFTPLS
jgi:sugar/nucleoside kinase (ribokinase family)